MSDRHTLPPYSLRMPPDLRDQLEESARQGSRSLNAEIIHRLQSTFTPLESAIERGRRIEKLKGGVDPKLESLVSSFIAQIELEIQRQAGELAEDRAKKE